jgi:hypothetical protein
MKAARSRALGLFLACCLLLSVPTSLPTAAAQDGTPYLFGTLLSDPRHVQPEYAAGVRDGQFSDAYAAAARDRLRAFRAAGMRVVLGLGLHYPPRWAYDLPGARYLNQFGRPASPLNLTFSQVLRERAERYLARVVSDLGPDSFWAVRIGAGGFDQAAQGGVGRPPTIPPSPHPGWRPGDRTYQGRPFSRSEVREWYEWYLGALVDGIRWQVAAYDWYGFSGYRQVLMPGVGSRPPEFETAMAHYLDGTGDPYGTLARAAVWNRVIDRLADLPGVVAYVSSLADGSGRDDVCRPEDRWTSLYDPVITSWSSARWISYNADRYGLPKMGENPGRVDSIAYGRRMSEAAARQMQACGFQGLMWAHAADLHAGASDLTLWDYAAVIARYSR